MKKIKCLSMTVLVLGLMCMFTINSEAQQLKVVNQNQSAIKVEQKKAKANAMTHKAVERKDKVDLRAKSATRNATLNTNQQLVKTPATTRTAPNNAKKAQPVTRNAATQNLKLQPATQRTTLNVNQKIVKTSAANRTATNAVKRTQQPTNQASDQDLKAKSATQRAALNTNQKLVKTSANRTAVRPTNRTTKKTNTTVQQPVLLKKAAVINAKKPVLKTVNTSNLKPITIQNQ